MAMRKAPYAKEEDLLMRTNGKNAKALRKTETRPWAYQPARIKERIDSYEDQFY